MANVHKFLRLAYASERDELMKELRVSTWMIKSTLSGGDRFYEGVATNGTGWVWLHNYGYCSRLNLTYQTPVPTLEWSFACHIPSLHARDEVSWAYVPPQNAARVMSDVASEHVKGSNHSDALKFAGIHRILTKAAF